MNQSFNKTNFSRIFYSENRKGVYLEGRFAIFMPLRRYTKLLEQIKKKINDGSYKRNSIKDKANKLKEKVKEKRNKKLDSILEFIESEIKNNPPNIDLNVNNINGKDIYTVDKSNPFIYFTLKQLQRNIKKAFKVSASNRHEIVSQVALLLDDNYPKYVLRADIKDFYETIPHDKLFEKIESNLFLDSKSTLIIKDILNSYSGLSSNHEGVPRGIGVSAFLSEIFLRGIDNHIKSFSELLYYARYVDDFLLIFTPKNNTDLSKYRGKLKSMINKSGLTLNINKTKTWDCVSNISRNLSIDFLGYNFHKSPAEKIKFKEDFDRQYLNSKSQEIDNAKNFYQNYCNKPELLTFDLNQNLSDVDKKQICKIVKFYNDTNKKLLLKLTNKKIDKYHNRIEKAIESYNKSSKFNERNARSLLFKRFKYLTSNTRLVNAKSNILLGIYFSNSLVTDYKCLRDLDEYYKHSIDSLINPYYKLAHLDSTKLKNELKKLSFLDGFLNIKFHAFKSTEIKKILKIW